MIRLRRIASGSLQLYRHDVLLAVHFYGCLYRVAVLGQVPVLLLDLALPVEIRFTVFACRNPVLFFVVVRYHDFGVFLCFLLFYLLQVKKYTVICA